MSAVLTSEPLAALVAERDRVLNAFLEREQERIARLCHDLARAFARGGALIAHGSGGAATDAAHVAVEFMHPVIVGKRALPALALANDPTGATTPAAFGRPDDIALAIAHGSADASLREFLDGAGRQGMLTVALVGAGGGEAPIADHVLVVESGDPQIVQEVQETTYHVLWELVHVFFEHPGLLDDACITCGDVAVAARVVSVGERSAVVELDGAREEVASDLVDAVVVGDMLLCHAGVALERLDAEEEPEAPDPTAFLYPFLGREETDLDTVLADVRSSTIAKGADVSALRSELDLAAVQSAALAIGERLAAGARVLCFGNGGSATDAADLASDLLTAGWPAVALNNDSATISAVANDVGFDNVFSRQLIALARHGDVAVGISTSGSSPNILAALEEARRRGMLTCAIVGHDGGRIAQLDWLDHLFVVHSDYIPRVQEAQATIYHLLVSAIGGRR